VLTEIWNELLSTSWIELIAVISLVGYVVLATRESPWCWPVSMVGVALYFVVSLDAKLYAELPLQVLYFSISIYGWYHWRHGGKRAQPLPVSTLSIQRIGLLMIIWLATFLPTGFALRAYSDSDVPFWDAATTWASVIGTWLQAQKKLENWIVWIVTDAVYVGIFWYKGYVLFSALNILYIVLASYGYWSWRKSYHTQQHAI
jgi:nicotinamide mononucleotide transporter